MKEIAQAFLIIPQQRVVLDITRGYKLFCSFIRLLLVDEKLVTSEGVFSTFRTARLSFGSTALIMVFSLC